MSIRFAEGGRERIKAQALALSRLESAPRAEELLDTLTAFAAAWCGRKDVPEEMEGAMAILLSRQLKDAGEHPVTSVKRGDTAITYDTAAGGFFGDGQKLLAPFMRLRSPGKEKQNG